jgi:hypothetical protein
LKNKQWIGYAAVALALLIFALWARSHVQFQWSVFRDQIQHVEWSRIVVGLLMIYLGYVIRGVRWMLLIKPQKRVGIFSLVGTQVIGFTGVALLGRPADLARPYLVARRTQLPLVSQIAVYIVERTFDFGSTALIFATALLLAPDRATLPHHEFLTRAALSAVPIFFAVVVMAIVVRVAGKPVARAAAKAFGSISPTLGHSVESKVLAFRDGLNAVGGAGDFLLLAVISLAMWGMIVISYLEIMRAFVLSPELSNMTFARVLVLMAASMVSSAVQLPVVGWFSQIALVATTMKVVLNVPSEPALGCATMILIVTFMSVIPLGLIWARFEHVSLKKVSRESEAEAEATADAAVSEA